MPPPTPTAAILWLHDHGERDPYALEPHVRPHIPWVQFMCPASQIRTGPKGPLPSWFVMPDGMISDLASSTPEGLHECIKHVHDRLDELVQTTSFESSRIAIGGFGQGGALALAAGLAYKLPLAGIVCHSGWTCQPAFELASMNASPNLVSTPIMLLAGDEDEVVERRATEASAAALRAAGAQQVIFRGFEEMEHKFCKDSLGVMIDFLRSRLPEKASVNPAEGGSSALGAKSKSVIKMGGRRGAAPAPAPAESPEPPPPSPPPVSSVSPAPKPTPAPAPKTAPMPTPSPRATAAPSPPPPPAGGVSNDPATAAALASGDIDELRRALEPAERRAWLHEHSAQVTMRTGAAAAAVEMGGVVMGGGAG